MKSDCSQGSNNMSMKCGIYQGKKVETETFVSYWNMCLLVTIAKWEFVKDNKYLRHFFWGQPCIMKVINFVIKFDKEDSLFVAVCSVCSSRFAFYFNNLTLFSLKNLYLFTFLLSERVAFKWRKSPVIKRESEITIALWEQFIEW